MRCEEVVIWLELTENIAEIGRDGSGEDDRRRERCDEEEICN